MAAPPFVGAGAGVTIASGSGAVTAAGSGVAVGDLIILQVLQDGVAASAVSYSAISGIANLAGTASSLTTLATDQPCGTLAKQHLRVGRATSTTCSVTVATTGDDLYYRIYVFRDVASGVNLTDILENGTAGTIVNGSGATAAITDTAVVTLGSDRLALQFVGVDDDNPLGPFTGMSGGVWVEAVAAFVTATGTDAAIQLQLGCETSITTTTSGTLLAFGNTASFEMRGQSFLPVAAATLKSVALRLRKDGSPLDNLVVEIRSDSGGAPSTTVLATASMAMSGVTAAATPVTYSFALDLALSASTTYWIVVRRSGALDAANFPEVELTGSVYAGGVQKIFGSGAWGAATTDLYFAIRTAGLASAGTIDGGSFTMAAADNWGVIGFALKPAATGPATLERSAALALVGLIATLSQKLLLRTAALNATGAVASAGVKVTPVVTHERSAALTVTATIASAGVFWTIFGRQAELGATGTIQSGGISIVSAAAALTATGLITTVGRETLARTAALTATGLIASSGGKLAVHSRSAAVSATGLIASAGRELLPRLARVDATGTISASGVGFTVFSRTAAISATGSIATVGRESLARTAVLTATGLIATVGRKQAARSAALNASAAVAAIGQIEGGAATIERSAALSAGGQIASAGRETLSRSAALAATAAIASAGRELLPRLVRVDATGLIATVGQRRLQRQTALGATGSIQAGATTAATVSRSAALNATGAIQTVGRRQRHRSAALTATGTITSARLRVHARKAVVDATGQIASASRRRLQRQTVVTATAQVTVAYQRSWSSSATLNASGAVAATPRRLLLRAAALNAVAGWETIAGGPTAQFAFDAVATISAGAWPAGAITTATRGWIDHGNGGGIDYGEPGELVGAGAGYLAKIGG